ncbi:unnamed protein product [Closterium sp. NIES-53]
MAGPEERGGRGAGGSGEAQAQGQPRDSAMAPMQPSLGPPRDEPRVLGLEKFNGDNFAKWSFKMENIFDHYDLLEVMEGTKKRPENDPEKSPWVRKSAQGYLLLGQALGSSLIRHIKPFQREPEKGPKAWAALKGVHAPATAAVAVVLERQMAALRIEEDEAVEEGVQKFFDLLTRLEGADLNYTDLQKKTKLLALLPESWSLLIINLNRDLPRLSLEDMKRAILQEDFRRRELASADGAGAASIGRGYGRGRGRGRGGGRFGGSNCNGGPGSSGHGNDNKNNGRGRGRGAGGGRGRGRGGRGGRGGGAASMKSAGNESESRDDRFPGQFFFVSMQGLAGPEKDQGFEEPAAVEKVTLHSLDYWVIDSGATYSMTPRADLLTELEPSPVKHVTSALGQRAEVKGMGKAMFKGADGKMVGLKNVLWVPKLDANLISVRRLQKAGMDTSSKGAKTYTARLDERILWDLNENKDVYNEMWQIPVVPMPKERQVGASISTKVTSKLSEHEESGAAAKKQHKDEENPKAAAEEYGENMWDTIASAAFSNPTSATGECDWLTLHRRMVHVAVPILQQLVKNEMVAGIRVKGEPDEVLGCPTCMQAKFTRYQFSSSEATAKAPLDEVVMDVVGPLKLGAAGAEYFLTIVDVYTRMTWVYVLSKKSDVAETVKTDWLPMVERQQDRLVKAIRTDRGGEFLSKEFSLWLKKNGIRHSLTMPYSPAMNGIAEQANRTITETARGLLIEAGLPKYFWPDAVRSACAAKKRALTHVGAEKWVPYVEWIGRKPKVDMLRVFGCMCMALVPKHLRHNKLGAKAIWAVHLGMAQNSKGWLLWDPFSKEFLVSRDCKFMENLMYKDWKAENEAKIGMRFGEVKSSGLEHVELPLELSSGSTTTRQSSLVHWGEEAKDAEEEEEEVQQQCQGLHVPAAEEEGRGKRRAQAPNRLTYEALGKPAKSALAKAALIVGDDEESEYDEYAFAFFSPVEMPGEPATLKEALESSDAEEWKKAMESELKSIEENGTWELVELLKALKAITSKWLFKIKSDADGKIERYKSRLVAKEYQQKEKVDYKELFAHVVKPTTLRTLLAGAAIKRWVVKQMDVTTGLLDGVLEEEIFMAQPQGFDDGSRRVLKLKNALYGVKQAPRQWYLKLRGVLEEIGFTPSTADHSLFMLGEGEQRSFMVVYVDDILIFSPSSDLVKEVMLKLQDKFKCKALGDCVKGPEEESVGEEERHRFHSLVGSLMYAAVNTRPDVAFATGQLARVVQCPNEEQGKLTPSGQRTGLHLGVSPESKGWEVLHLTDNKVVTSVEVIFYETLSLEVWKAKFGPTSGRTQARLLTDTLTVMVPLLAEVDAPADEDILEGSLEALHVALTNDIASGRQGAKLVNQDGKPSTTGEEQTGEPVEQVASAGVQLTGELSKSAEDLAVNEEGELSARKNSTDSDVVEVPITKPELRCTGRARRPPERLSFYACLPPAAFTTMYDEVDDDLLYDNAEEDEELLELDPDMHADPEHRWDITTMTVKEAMASWKGEAVKAAMEEEICSLIGMGTWELVEHPRGVNIMKNQSVRTTKYRIEDTVERKKARLVVKGFTQVCGACGADYNKTYASVSSYVTLRIFLSIVAVLDLILMQLDMKNAFLQSKLDKVLYMYQPDYFDDGTGRGTRRCAAGRGLEEEPGRRGTLLQGRQQRSDLLGAGLRYVAATDAGKEGRRLRFLLAEFKLLDARKPTILRIDNKSAITVAEGLGLTGNLKHMEQRYDWLQHMVRRRKFILKYIPTTEQPAEFLTNGLHSPAFNRCSVTIGQVRLADVGDGNDDVQQ